MACLSGSVEEVTYAMPDVVTLSHLYGDHACPSPRALGVPGVLRSSSPCPVMVEAGTARLRKGAVGYVSDYSGTLHAVRCGSGEPCAVTLHCYAPPITRCRLFEPAEDRVTTREPGFASIGGIRSAGATGITGPSQQPSWVGEEHALPN